MERLDPRVRVTWAVGLLGGATVLGAVLAGVGVFLDVGGLWLLSVLLAVVGLAHVVARYRRWRFSVGDEALYLQRGVLTHVETSVPFVRVQHVDTRRGPLERLLGLSSVVVYTAGSRGADVAIPGLAPERAERLRERLRDLAIDSEREDAV
jgi:membrane protein YdbS with pleckstrin-like domain